MSLTTDVLHQSAPIGDTALQSITEDVVEGEGGREGVKGERKGEGESGGGEEEGESERSVRRKESGGRGGGEEGEGGGRGEGEEGDISRACGDQKVKSQPEKNVSISNSLSASNL